MKPDYKNMTRSELKEHLLCHRHDDKARAVFFEQLNNLDPYLGYPHVKKVKKQAISN